MAAEVLATRWDVGELDARFDDFVSGRMEQEEAQGYANTLKQIQRGELPGVEVGTDAARYLRDHPDVLENPPFTPQAPGVIHSEISDQVLETSEHSLPLQTVDLDHRDDQDRGPWSKANLLKNGGKLVGGVILISAVVVGGSRLVGGSSETPPAASISASAATQNAAPSSGQSAASKAPSGPYLHLDGVKIIDGKIEFSDTKCYLSGIGIQWNATSTISGERIDFAAIPDQSTLGGPKKPLLWIHEPTPDVWFNVHDGVEWDLPAGVLRVTNQAVMTGNNGEGGTPTGRVTLSAPLACPK